MSDQLYIVGPLHVTTMDYWGGYLHYEDHGDFIRVINNTKPSEVTVKTSRGEVTIPAKKRGKLWLTQHPPKE